MQFVEKRTRPHLRDGMGPPKTRVPPKKRAKLNVRPKRGAIAKVKAIQFGLLSSAAAEKLSVIQERDELDHRRRVGITKWSELFDSRLGIPNPRQRCATCTGTKRGNLDDQSCDGHFGHIGLPQPIYHPHLIRKCVKILSSICLGCGRVLEKKKRKNILDAVFEERGARLAKAGQKRKRGAKGKGADVASLVMGSLAHLPVKQELEYSYLPGINGQGPSLPLPCKQEPIEIDDETCVPEEARPFHSDPGGAGPSNIFQDVTMLSIGEPGLCKYCGGPDGDGTKLPKIKVKIVSKGERNAKIETIRLWVDEKAGELPPDFWQFVKGHPKLSTDKNRTLLPSEALTILQKISTNDVAKLQMDALVSLPRDFILKNILVTPTCNRFAMEEWNTNANSKLLLRNSRQNTKLEALVRKARQVKPRKSGQDDFDDLQQAYEELQLVSGRHFRAGKVIEYRMLTGQEIEESGGSLELKWLKANVLAKRSNYSARTIITGDPFMMVEEIGVPIEIARRLTLDEKINRMNIDKWQMAVNDYMRGDRAFSPGRFTLTKRNGDFRDLENIRMKNLGVDLRSPEFKLELGDVITRGLRDGDHVFANRPPSLHKHSLIALTVKVSPLSTFAINPLICPPFDADFDGDAFHVFVPQSLECVAELRELMSVPQQMICPQGGQPLLGLTQDTLVGGHLLTNGHVFINRVDMQQLSMWCSSKMPQPAILKAPGHTGPFWTGRQVFSMTLPDGLNFGELGTELFSSGGKKFRSKSKSGPAGDVLIRDGEILTSQGGAKWLERSPKALVRAICDHAGPKAAVDHLNWLQSLLHQWFLMRGFSVGLLDFHACEDFDARREMLDGVEKSLHIANEEALKRAVKLDRQVQHRILFPVRQELSGSELVEEHQGCFGLFLGDDVKNERIAALQGPAIERFQALSPIIEDLVTGYMDRDNSLLAMQKSGSKGSLAKLMQQVGCLGLQLFKGDRLVPLRPCNKLSYLETSRNPSKSRIFQERRSDHRPVGYWESRGIIRSSYVDGLNPLEFFLDSTASRLNVMRQGIEEPNQILKGLMLFLRDTHIAYDGTLRSRGGNNIIQFQYGRPEKQPESSNSPALEPSLGSRLAGEPVGVLAATSIAEPAYNVKMQSIHQALALGIAPVHLLKETLVSRSKSKLKTSDRRCILRLPHGFGKERRALNVIKGLRTITVEMITIASAIVFAKLDGRKHVIATGAGDDEFVAKPFKRLSPWVGHVVLCKKAVEEQNINLDTLIERLTNVHSGKGVDDNHGICFQYSVRCKLNAHPHGGGMCIIFFPIISPESSPLSSFEFRAEKMATLLETMKNVMMPAILNTTVTARPDSIEKARIIWEEGGSASRLPREVLGRLSVHQSSQQDPGELVIEVIVKETKGAGKRGAAWRAAVEACMAVEEAIDWTRSGPYSIQETYATYGVAAAQHQIVQRLALATKNMGKPVREEHLTLVADTMTHCGIVTGLSSGGYRDYCTLLSISTPFSEAAFQQPKKTFIDAATRGAAEIIDGALPASVWGTRIPVGTGTAFEIKAEAPKTKTQKWPFDPFKLLKEVKESEARRTRSRVRSRGFKSVKSAAAFDLKADNKLGREPKKVDSEERESRLGKGRTPFFHDAEDESGYENTLGKWEKDNDIVDDAAGKVHGKHGIPGTIEEIDKETTVLTLKNGFKIFCVDRGRSEVLPEDEELMSEVQGMDVAVDASVATKAQNEDSGVKPSKLRAPRVGFRDVARTNSGDVPLRDSPLSADCNQERVPASTLDFDWSFSRSESLPVAGKKGPHIRERFMPSAEADEARREGDAEGPVLDTNFGRSHSETPMKGRLPEKVHPHGNLWKAHSAGVMNGFVDEARQSLEKISGEREKLHSLLHARYRVGERVQVDTEKMILEEVLIYHPNNIEKVGCGVEYVKVDRHPKHPESRCFQIVRKDGSCTDFSYHKCLDAKLSKLGSSRYS